MAKSTVLRFTQDQNDRRKAIHKTHSECWLRGIAEYERDATRSPATEGTSEAAGEQVSVA